MAAVLACGVGAVLSHRSAGQLRSIHRTSRSRIDVTGVGGRHHHGIDFHAVRGLHPDDVTIVDGIPVTSLARTLLDLAEVVPYTTLERAVEAAERLAVFDLRAIDELCARSRGRRGLKPLRAAIAPARPAASDWTNSGHELALLRICRDAGLPQPAVNLYVEGEVVDAYWDDPRVIAEIDSRAYHQTSAAFERDAPATPSSKSPAAAWSASPTRCSSTTRWRAR